MNNEDRSRHVDEAIHSVHLAGLDLTPAAAADAASYAAGNITLDEYGARTRARHNAPADEDRSTPPPHREQAVARPLFNDWAHAGRSAVRALLAEGVAAEIAEATTPGATWYGGQKGAYDVESSGMRYDAKAVRVDSGYVILTRRNAEPFDPARVDQLVLVDLTAETGYDIDLPGRTAQVHARATVEHVWVVPVKDMNALLPAHNPETDPMWRQVELPLEALDPFRFSAPAPTP